MRKTLPLAALLVSGCASAPRKAPLAPLVGCGETSYTIPLSATVVTPLRLCFLQDGSVLWMQGAQTPVIPPPLPPTETPKAAPPPAVQKHRRIK